MVVISAIIVIQKAREQKRKSKTITLWVATSLWGHVVAFSRDVHYLFSDGLNS